jgi:hypothetical protein
VQNGLILSVAIGAEVMPEHIGGYLKSSPSTPRLTRTSAA